jgi:hypothetical protein
VNIFCYFRVTFFCVFERGERGEGEERGNGMGRASGSGRCEREAEGAKGRVTQEGEGAGEVGR